MTGAVTGAVTFDGESTGHGGPPKPRRARRGFGEGVALGQLPAAVQRPAQRGLSPLAADSDMPTRIRRAGNGGGAGEAGRWRRSWWSTGGT